MAPVGALKQKKPGSSKAVAIVDGLQMLTMQRAAASEQRESARMVSAVAAKEHMDKKIDLANKKIELEQRKLEQDEKDRATSRSMRRDEHMLSIVVALHKAGLHMDDFVAQRAALARSDATTTTDADQSATAPATTGTAAVIHGMSEPLSLAGAAHAPPQSLPSGGPSADAGGHGDTPEKK